MQSTLEIEKYSLIMSFIEKDIDIILIEIGDSHEIDLEAAMEIVDYRIDFTKNKEHYMILDVSNVKTVSAEAKEFLQRKEGGLKNIIGAAFIAPNPVSALIANVFVKTPTNFKVKVFSNKANALKWILEYKKENSRLSK